MTTAPLSELLEKLEREATKGPWEAFLGGTSATPTVDIHLQRRTDVPVVHWTGFDASGAPKAEWKPNATLICTLVNNLALIRACVELAEAVDKSLAGCAPSVMVPPNTMGFTPEFVSALSKVRAAKEAPDAGR